MGVYTWPWAFLWQQHDLHGVARWIDWNPRADEKSWMIEAKVGSQNGRTLMPGLTDTHGHVCAVEGNISEQHHNNPPSLIAAKTLRRIEQALMQGFTRVEDPIRPRGGRFTLRAGARGAPPCPGARPSATPPSAASPATAAEG